MGRAKLTPEEIAIKNKERKRKYYYSHQKEISDAGKKYYQENKNKITEYGKTYREKEGYRERANAYNRDWAKKNPDKKREQGKRWVAGHREAYQQYQKEYRTGVGKPKVNESTKKWAHRNRTYLKGWYHAQKEKLADYYVRRFFYKRGVKQFEITPEMIELKRLQIQGLRKVNQLKQNINERNQANVSL